MMHVPTKIKSSQGFNTE